MMLHHFRIFRVTFEKNAYGLDAEYDSFRTEDKSKISNMRPMAFIDFNDKETSGYILYIIIDEKSLFEYEAILQRYYISYSVDDITDMALSGKILEQEITSRVSRSGMAVFDYFSKRLDEWRSGNLTIDAVLDRINEVGIQSLSDFEKEFLKNYNHM